MELLDCGRWNGNVREHNEVHSNSVLSHSDANAYGYEHTNLYRYVDADRYEHSNAYGDTYSHSDADAIWSYADIYTSEPVQDAANNRAG